MRQNLEVDLLRTFVTIADTGSFTRAAEQLLRNQSTISLQLKRLEETSGQTLLVRTSRKVRVTAEGHIMLDYARRILALNDEVVARINGPQLTGVVRLGTPEDFATTHLPEVLAQFSRTHPGIALEVTCELTLNLIDRFRQDEFDLALIKREPVGKLGGARIWREPLVWAMADRTFVDRTGPLPLVVSPSPCVYRKRATGALDRIKRPWRIAYTCGSLAGALAAVKAGLGITVLPKKMIPEGLVVIDGGHRLPKLRDTEITLLVSSQLSAPADRLRDHIVRSLERT